MDSPVQAPSQTLSHWPRIPGRKAGSLQASVSLSFCPMMMLRGQQNTGQWRDGSLSIFVDSAWTVIQNPKPSTLEGIWLPSLNMFWFYSNTILWRIPLVKTEDQFYNKFRFLTFIQYQVHLENHKINLMTTICNQSPGAQWSQTWGILWSTL